MPTKILAMDALEHGDHMNMNNEDDHKHSPSSQTGELDDGSSNTFLHMDSFTDTEIGTETDMSDFSDPYVGGEGGGGHEMWMTPSTDPKDGPNSRAQPTPLPKLRMTICFFLQISEALNVTTLFP